MKDIKCARYLCFKKPLIFCFYKTISGKYITNIFCKNHFQQNSIEFVDKVKIISEEQYIKYMSIL